MTAWGPGPSTSVPLCRRRVWAHSLTERGVAGRWHRRRGEPGRDAAAAAVAAGAGRPGRLGNDSLARDPAHVLNPGGVLADGEPPSGLHSGGPTDSSTPRLT